MLYADESVLRLEMGTTAEELLKEALEKRGITPTKFGEMMGYKFGYQGTHNLLSGKTRFTPKLQEQAAVLLRLPRNHFEQPEKTAAVEKYVKETFAKFLKTEIGARIEKRPERAILESLVFESKKLPTVALYQALALALEGHGTVDLDALEASSELNAKLDEDIERTGGGIKPSTPPKGRRRKAK